MIHSEKQQQRMSFHNGIHMYMERQLLSVGKLREPGVWMSWAFSSSQTHFSL